MIIAMCLKEIFKDKTINVNGLDIPLQFHFGDQKELNRWISNKTLYQKQKYPLIWYVINDVEPLSNNGLKVNTQLIIFYLSKSEYMNDSRFEKSYIKYIEPTYNLVNQTLSSNPHIRTIDRNGFKYKDEPNFGVEVNDANSSNSDFKKTTSKGNKAITLDIVDARVMNFNVDVYPICIIK